MAFAHRHLWHSISRRQFLGAAAATAGALATGLRIPPVSAGSDELATIFPLPIPGGVTAGPFPDGFSAFVHHFPSPVPNDHLPISEPSEITDFNGVVGLCRVHGTGTSTAGPLTYQVDNGFMSGLYRGEDGRMHHGTFAFIWMDLYKGAVGILANQIHDFNPGIRKSGLFWTEPVNESALQFDFEARTARLALKDFDIDDYGNLENALKEGEEVDASVSFDMTWTATGDPFNVSDPVHQFEGRFSLANVDISWSGAVGSFEFTSSPGITQIKSYFGRERNGIFFSED